MKKANVWLWGKWAIAVVTVTALSACVEIKSDAKIASDSKVSFSTTYDMSKILPTLQQISKDGAEVAKNLSCDKMNEKLTKELKCKDLAPGKFVVSGEFTGDAAHGINVDKDKNQMSVDAVQLFKTIADLNPAKNETTEADAASMVLQRGLVPVAADQAATYKQMGMVLAMNVTMPADVLTIDGVAAKDIKENTVAINFIDVAGKDTYLITSKLTKSRFIFKIIFILLSIALLVGAVLYLVKRNKAHNPIAPAPSTPAATNNMMDAAPASPENAEQNKVDDSKNEVVDKEPPKA
ncbi:hypothetical protein [Hydromonas duriensis]|uniref:Lipoprotein n=1 Tax=Hydromonas duriensis TaxID=1527608 RepID=A0A4R6Y8T2_9BURK|nr:hypothetical protein [Hydromonas duriensis]TDR31834.1 hypothetical protein DFR44_10751 [Hydromonas duriensis]